MTGTTRMTKLNLQDHKTVLASQISLLQWNEQFADLKIVCQDGFLMSHRVILCGVSPFLKSIFFDQPDVGDDQLTVLVFPEIKKIEMISLLSLLYSGKANLYKSEIPSFIRLTQLLKMKNIPVVVNEDKWTVRCPNQTVVDDNLLSTRKVKTRRKVDEVKIKSSPILSTKRTRSGRLVVPKKYDDQIVLFDDVDKDLSNGGNKSDMTNVENFEFVTNNTSDPDEKQKCETIGPSTPSKRSRGRPKKTTKCPKQNSRVEPTTSRSDVAGLVAAGGEMEGLDNLLSVAEAFERSQQPDFNDINNPVLDTSDTHKKLLRVCVLCGKQVLGRNAYGRHMKNAHPKVFGPYSCPVDDCGRRMESGVKIMQHMHTHVGPRAQALAQGQRFSCGDCSAVYTTSSRLNDHLRKKHGAKSGMNETKFRCNANLSSSSSLDVCALEFSTAKLFTVHMSKVHSLKPWLCQICTKRFKERQNYQYHSMMHEGVKSFNCDICQKSFSNPRQLYCHRALHLGRRFLCAQCGYRARSSANLRGHVKSKHEGRQFECKFCLKKFGSGNNLKNHIRIHTGETPFECELCGVKFKRMHHLHSHIESKLHSEIMDKVRKKGFSVPDHLDPAKRPRGRDVVEDGPITCVTVEELVEARAEEDQGCPKGKIRQHDVNVPWNNEFSSVDVGSQNLIVLDDNTSCSPAYVIPLEGGDTVEIVESADLEEVGNDHIVTAAFIVPTEYIDQEV